MSRRMDDERVVKLTIRVVEDVHTAMKAAARSRYRSLNELVNRLIHDYLVAHDREEVRRWHEQQAAEHGERIDRIRRGLDR